ncbi:SgcJ/EcaC family oxidoreductase [Micromonospora sp. NPDC050980]|uniref:SgcJ/EcaC family oxidoreductase n=1 Tax=Micromonospora sp. NPDC050980 TaxID=3155161 RepID=UPI00341067D5
MSTSSPAATADVATAAQAVPQRIVAAWKNNDADAFAATFTEDGSMILPGVYLAGRDKIRSFMADAFAGPYAGTQVFGEPISLRPLSENVVLVITRGGVLAPGDTEVAEERSIRATWTLTRDGDGWALAAYQNTPANA